MNKHIYFYWGNDTMSYMRYITLYSFCMFNPDWCVYLIKNNQPDKRYLINTIEKQDKTEYNGKDYSYLISDLNINIIEFENNMIDLENNIVKHMSDVHIKDILNWKILSDWGGVVADMDILFRCPIGNSIENKSDIGLVCFDGYPKKNYIPVSFMYSSGNNEFFKKAYKNALRNYKSNVYESCGTLCIEEKNLNEIKENFPSLIVQKFKDFIVFPFIDWPWGEGIEMLYNDDNRHLMKPNSIGIHWYGGAPLSQVYNNLLNEQTIYEINNTISITIKEVLQCQSHNSQKKVPI